MEFRLSHLKRSHKVLMGCFVFTLIIGYAVALLQGLEHTQGYSTEHMVLEYRGSEDPDLMAFPKEYREVLQNTHAHALSVPVVFFLLSLIFLGSEASEKQKTLLVALLFAGFICDHLGLWLLRYVHQGFVYLSVLGHVLTTPVYLLMCFISLRDTFKSP